MSATLNISDFIAAWIGRMRAAASAYPAVPFDGHVALPIWLAESAREQADRVFLVLDATPLEKRDLRWAEELIQDAGMALLTAWGEAMTTFGSDDERWAKTAADEAMRIYRERLDKLAPGLHAGGVDLMGSLSPETIARVTKLLPMLSSDKAGEVAAAAAAIGRALKTGGGDWHDLAEQLGRTAPEVVYINAFGQRTKPPADTPPLFERLRRSEKLFWLDHAVASDQLDGVEQALCITMRAQVFSQPHKTVPPKHCAAISVALGKLWVAGVRA